MNKVIPIVSIVISVLCATVSAMGLTLVCIATAVPQFTGVAVPAAIVGAVISLLSGGFDILFRKSKLCRIALFVCIAAAVVSAISITVWLCAL